MAKTPKKKPRKKKKKDTAVSLAPLSFEEAVKALLETKTEKKK